MKFIIISIKEYFFMIIFLLFIICLLCFSNNNLIAAQNGLVLWANKVLPTLFPFFVATELLCQTNFSYIFGKFLSKFITPIFNVPGDSVIAIILGTISGYPIGAKVVCNLKKQKIISKIEAERLISFTNNSGPLFILGTVGIALFKNKKIGYILLISHILSSLVVGYCFKFWKKDKFDINYREAKFNSKQTPIKISDIGEILGNAIKNSIFSLLLIGGFIVLFSVILSILETSGIIYVLIKILENFNLSEEISKSLIYGLIELTNGVNLSSALFVDFPKLSILLTSFLLGFGGISVLLQVYSIISKENISIKPYLYGKILHGIFSVIITFILI